MEKLVDEKFEIFKHNNHLFSIKTINLNWWEQKMLLQYLFLMLASKTNHWIFFGNRPEDIQVCRQAVDKMLDLLSSKLPEITLKDPFAVFHGVNNLFKNDEFAETMMRLMLNFEHGCLMFTDDSLSVEVEELGKLFYSLQWDQIFTHSSGYKLYKGIEEGVYWIDNQFSTQIVSIEEVKRCFVFL